MTTHLYCVRMLHLKHDVYIGVVVGYREVEPVLRKNRTSHWIRTLGTENFRGMNLRVDRLRHVKLCFSLLSYYSLSCPFYILYCTFLDQCMEIDHSHCFSPLTHTLHSALYVHSYLEVSMSYSSRVVKLSHYYRLRSLDSVGTCSY